MAALDVTALEEALKQALPSKRIQYVGYQGNPTLAVIPKDTDFGGDLFRVPIWYGGNQGVSSTFAKAQANKTGGLYESFKLTRVRKYGLTSIGTEALLASNKDAYAFLKAAVSEVDQTTRNVSNDLGMALFRNHGGARGQIASGSSSTTLTLVNKEDIVHFHKGMKITSSNTDGTSGADDGEALEISAVDLEAGTISKTGTDWDASGNFAASDYLFREGDFGLAMSGFESWVPASAPGATAFFGVDRTQDVVRLGGMRHDGSGGSYEDAFQDACAKLEREGAEPDLIVMHPKDFTEFRKSLNDRITYDDVKATGDVPLTFKAIVLPGLGKGGTIRVMKDRNAIKGVANMLQLDTWVLASLGPCPQMLKAMGQGSVIWDYNADSVEVRIGGYFQLGCFAPGFNCRIKLPS